MRIRDVERFTFTIHLLLAIDKCISIYTYSVLIEVHLVLCNPIKQKHFCLYLFFETKIKSTRMGKFYHSKKHYGDKKKSSSSRPKYDLTQSGRKLPEDFLYTQNHKNIRISLATSSTRDLQKKISARSWMKTRSQETRPLQQFHQCCNSSRKLQDRSNRKRQGESGNEHKHLRTSPTQRDRHSTSMELRS